MLVVVKEQENNGERSVCLSSSGCANFHKYIGTIVKTYSLEEKKKRQLRNEGRVRDKKKKKKT